MDILLVPGELWSAHLHQLSQFTKQAAAQFSHSLLTIMSQLCKHANVPKGLEQLYDQAIYYAIINFLLSSLALSDAAFHPKHWKTYDIHHAAKHVCLEFKSC